MGEGDDPELRILSLSLVWRELTTYVFPTPATGALKLSHILALPPAPPTLREKTRLGNAAPISKLPHHTHPRHPSLARTVSKRHGITAQQTTWTPICLMMMACAIAFARLRSFWTQVRPPLLLCPCRVPMQIANP